MNSFNIRAHGVQSFHIDNVAYRVKGDVTVNMGFYKKEPVSGSSPGEHGHVLKKQESFFELTLTMLGNDDITAINNKNDISALLTLWNGKRIKMECGEIDIADFNPTEGELKVKLFSQFPLIEAPNSK